jgi:spore maturation protein CgeB
MSAPLRIAFFGSSLVSSYWNGAATYYRGIVRALAVRGHRVTFYEPDAFERQSHRDMDDPDWARVVVYPARRPDDALAALDRARDSDLVIKASGVGVFDALLEREVLALRRPGTSVLFWDVDAPATLERLDNDAADPFIPLISRYDLVLTYGGGQPVVDAYRARGARDCVPIYNALDPTTHHPVPPDPRFEARLGFLGNRLPDREARVHEFFFEPARALPELQFLLGGSGWNADAGAPANVRLLGHVASRDHNAFNRTPRAVININRNSMAKTGYSPPTRVFEAAGAGACLLMDAWDGIELFLEPGTETLVVRNGDEVAHHAARLTTADARRIGEAALRRVLAEHTYEHRVRLLEEVLGARVSAGAAA